MAIVLGEPPDRARMDWRDHYRTWRKDRIAVPAREYGDRLDDLADLAARIKTSAPRATSRSLSGVCRGEALGLRSGNVDMERDRATIRQTILPIGHRPIVGKPKTAPGTVGSPRQAHLGERCAPIGKAN